MGPGSRPAPGLRRGLVGFAPPLDGRARRRAARQTRTEVDVIGQTPDRLKSRKPRAFDLGGSARWLEAHMRTVIRRGPLSARERGLADRLMQLKREAGRPS